MFQIGFFSNKAFLFSVGGSIISQLMVIYFQPLQKVFQTEAISLVDLLLIVAMTSSVWVVSEVKKFLEQSLSVGPLYKRSKSAFFNTNSKVDHFV